MTKIPFFSLILTLIFRSQTFGILFESEYLVNVDSQKNTTTAIILFENVRW